MERIMPRVQQVLLPVLRAELPHITFTTWIPNPDNRVYPLCNIRRLGGLPTDPRLLDKPVVELTVFSRGPVSVAEDHYLDVRNVVWDMYRFQTTTEHGYISSYFETLGPTLFDSPIEDTWRIQGLVQLGLRPIQK